MCFFRPLVQVLLLFVHRFTDLYHHHPHRSASPLAAWESHHCHHHHSYLNITSPLFTAAVYYHRLSLSIPSNTASFYYYCYLLIFVFYLLFFYIVPLAGLHTCMSIYCLFIYLIICRQPGTTFKISVHIFVVPLSIILYSPYPIFNNDINRYTITKNFSYFIYY